MPDADTLTWDESGSDERRAAVADVLALAIAWCREDVSRIGEVALVPPAKVEFVLGRSDPGERIRGPRLEFARHRPGSFEPQPGLGSPRISRRQLVVTARGTGAIAVENVGRCPARHNDVETQRAVLVPGDTLLLGKELVLVCVRRPARLPTQLTASGDFAFGRADRFGIVGESSTVWDLRRQIALLGPRREHVLVSGASGTGKELAARALHACSRSADRELLARSAATIPDGLADAELFGHARDYPNAGMRDRVGLIGSADGSTLLLDEIGELPSAVQTRLLRALDEGEYQRLGESGVRRSSFRLIGATNRPESLRDDVRARFKLRLHVPGLDERREDIALVLLHLLRTIAIKNPDLAPRLFTGSPEDGAPHVSAELVEHVIRRAFATHVRQLEALLWEAIQHGPDGPLSVPPNRGVATAAAGQHTSDHASPGAQRRESIRSALARNDWVVEKAWRELGLTSRHALARLMRKYDLTKPDEQ